MKTLKLISYLIIWLPVSLALAAIAAPLASLVVLGALAKYFYTEFIKSHAI